MQRVTAQAWQARRRPALSRRQKKDLANGDRYRNVYVSNIYIQIYIYVSLEGADPLRDFGAPLYTHIYIYIWFQNSKGKMKT